MSDFITPAELGINVDDYNFEIVEIGEIEYSSLMPFSPKQKIKVRINNKIFDMKIESLEHTKDFLTTFGYNEKEIKQIIQYKTESIKFEAVLKYINSKNYLRKRKLEKINKKCGN